MKMNWIRENMESIGAILIAVHALAVFIVNLTPTPKDDAALAKVYKLVEKLAGVVTKKVKE